MRLKVGFIHEKGREITFSPTCILSILPVLYLRIKLVSWYQYYLTALKKYENVCFIKNIPNRRNGRSVCGTVFTGGRHRF